MNLSIRTKLIAIFSLVLALLVGSSIMMIRKLSETNKSIGHVVDVSSQKVMLSDDILIALLEVTRHEKNIILERDFARRDMYRNWAERSIAEVNQKLPELQTMADASGKASLQNFEKIWDDYNKNFQKIVSLSYSGNTDAAYGLSSNENFEARNKAISLLNQMVNKNKQEMVADREISNISYQSALNTIVVMIVFCIVVALLSAYWLIRTITKRIESITEEANKIASREHSDAVITSDINDELQPVIESLISINDSFKEVTKHASRVASGNYSDNITPKSDKDILGNALNKMTVALKETTAENEKHNWVSTGLNKLSETLRGDKEVEVLADDTISFLCEYIDANVGAVYLADANSLEYTGGYAVTVTEDNLTIAFKEGLIGQAAESNKPIYIDGIHEEALVINSALIHKQPDHLMVVPFMFEGKIMGVLEIGSFKPFRDTDKEFIDGCLESIAVSVSSAISRRKIQMLLEETQVQSEELQSQQEELRQMNEELEEQTQGLKQQQEELQIANEELEEQTQALEVKNRELELAKYDIEEKGRQIELSSKYKSEFLANMSHELRTPLNSLLILSKDLSENRNNNLTSDQVECAEIIYNSGHDLLNLINEVLDLSKIEAGKMSVHVEKVYLKEFADTINKNFKHQADKKGLKFKVLMHKSLPGHIQTDRLRLDQIVKNLISNAIKFTDKGEVTVSLTAEPGNKVSIAVKDTGIGIPEDKQQYIFEAFQQADGGTSRRYGGTGLGLSISRELVKLLGAEIKLESHPGKGSTFTLTLPEELAQEEHVNNDFFTELPKPENTIVKQSDTVVMPDDRYQITQDDNIVLIIEDDLTFAKILLKQAQQKGFKGIVAATGENGLTLAEEYRPHAIIMDMNLPGIKGDRVVKELKKDPLLKHIPVHIISGEDRSLEMISSGAIEYLTKPIEKDQLEEAFNRIENVIDRKMKNVLIVEGDIAARANMCGLIAGGEVKCLEAQSGKEALKLYKKNHIDCIVLDLDLEDMTGFDLIYELEKIKPDAMAPVIVYTGRLLTKEENDELQRCTESVIIKGAKSEERLLNETALFLHRAISTMPESRNRKITNIQDKDALFKYKKVLLVDDDMRNVFALSKILKERGLEIIKAENGYSALNALELDPAIDIVLMDIMMPEMDGYETMQKIRLQAKFKNLPIIALTAKAMKEDRQKCIDAGANDYITKPVDVERLLSLMRVWLSK